MAALLRKECGVGGRSESGDTIMRWDINVYTAGLRWINSLYQGSAPGKETNSVRSLISY